MERLGRTHVYTSLLQNDNVNLSQEIKALVGLNERILRDIEPLFLTEGVMMDRES